MKLYNSSILRRIVLPFLKRCSFDFHMKHPWIKGTNVKLNLFKHKGYWYHGKNREKSSMLFFDFIIKSGEKQFFTIVEVGGHIGFVSLYFASLIEKNGKVFVFEPGSNNLPYIRDNIASSKYSNIIEIVELAIGESDGDVFLYEDSLTGQNNSLVKDFKGLKANKKRSYVSSDVKEKKIKMTSLDNYFDNYQDVVDFIKIDIEGYEWYALQGASALIKRWKPALMVEVQSNQIEILEYFHENDYILYNENRNLLKNPNELKGNVFCLYKHKHNELIERLDMS